MVDDLWTWPHMGLASGSYAGLTLSHSARVPVPQSCDHLWAATKPEVWGYPPCCGKHSLLGGPPCPGKGRLGAAILNLLSDDDGDVYPFFLFALHFTLCKLQVLPITLSWHCWNMRFQKKQQKTTRT